MSAETERAPDAKMVLMPVGWLRSLWATKSQWSPCPDCGANAYKPEDVKHRAGCRLEAVLRGASALPGVQRT